MRSTHGAGHTWTLRAVDVPGCLTAAGRAAFVKGFDARASAVISRRTDVDGHASEPPYRQRVMAQAWRAGWFFAKTQETT